jgi:2-methylcitrate dehydratase PrpD
LHSDDIPIEVIEKSKDCFLDTFGACIYGVDLPWSRILVDHALRYGSGGASSILGKPKEKVHTPMAALVNGALAHSFELDNVRQPGAGVHAGATLVTAGLAVAEEIGASGKELLTAFVAGCEVMFRIGKASRETSEQLGFHAPGLTGTLGAATTAGRLMGLDPQQMAGALGVAASLSSGILAFTKAGSGGMVKRLHLGRAPEGGVLAASLARNGFAGPDTILEGKFGFFEVFTREPDLEALTAGLGEDYEVMSICIKTFPCHITAQAPIQALRQLREEQSFSIDQIEAIDVAGSEKIVSHHDIPEPKDVMMAQYSLPFALALSLFHDPSDPRHFNEQNVRDEQVLALSRRIKPALDQAARHQRGYLGTRVAVQLKDGRRLTKDLKEFKGCPNNPLSRAELKEKFSTLASQTDKALAEQLPSRIERLEAVENVSHLLA